MDVLKEPKKKTEKACEGTTSPICTPHPPSAAATIFCMWGRTVDIVKHAKFQVKRFRGFGAQGPKMTFHRWQLAHRPYNSVQTNVLHCENSRTKCFTWSAAADVVARGVARFSGCSS